MIAKDIIQQARRLQILTRRKVNANFAGQYLSAFKGRGMEFAEIRPYQPGDDIRNIDWNVTARAGEPFVKTFIEERELNLLLAVDCSDSLNFASGPQSKRRLAAEFSAVLALAALRQQDKVGLMLFTDEVEQFIPPSKGRRHSLHIISELLNYESRGQRTSVDTALETAAQVLKKRTIVFLVSDFLSAPADLPLKLVNQRHDVIAVHISDAREFELPNVGLIRIQDWESGQQLVLDSSLPRVRTLYKARMNEQKQKTLKNFQKMGLDCLSLTTNQPFIPSLLKFFERRGGQR